MPPANIICPTSSWSPPATAAHSVAIEGEPSKTAGINSRAELAQLEADWQRRRREASARQGATLVEPETVWFAHDTRLGRDCTIEPHVVFGPGVTIGDGAAIRAFCHIEGATIAAGCEVGPFARLRPGAMLGEGAKVGNFVEMKKARLGKGAKANHLSYIGDADVGAKANIGAGTITCNYDGFFKYRTDDRRGRLHRLEQRPGRAGQRSAPARSSAPAR